MIYLIVFQLTFLHSVVFINSVCNDYTTLWWRIILYSTVFQLYTVHLYLSVSRSIDGGPAFSTRENLVPRFPVPRFPPPYFSRSPVFHSRVFSPRTNLLSKCNITVLCSGSFAGFLWHLFIAKSNNLESRSMLNSYFVRLIGNCK